MYHQIGENYIDVVKQGINNIKNTYYVLAHDTIKNFKQVQELIIDHREQEIVIAVSYTHLTLPTTPYV